jgi:hypothetical protein
MEKMDSCSRARAFLPTPCDTFLVGLMLLCTPQCTKDSATDYNARRPVRGTRRVKTVTWLPGLPICDLWAIFSLGGLFLTSYLFMAFFILSSLGVGGGQDRGLWL